jgi:hypothetical protein
MSKNIRGLSTANLTVKEISFVNLGATSVTATSFSGTTATFTGTVTNNLTVNGTFTLSGSLSIPSLQLTSLSSDTSSTGNLPVLFKDANNNVVINGDYTFKPSTGELRVTKVIGNVTGNLTGNITGATSIGGNTDITGTLGVSGQITGNVTGNLTGNVTGQVTLTAPNDTNSDNNFIPFITGATNNGLLSSNAQLFFNPNNQTLRSTNITAATNMTTPKLTLTGSTYDCQIKTDTSGNNFGTFYHNEKGHILAMGSNANNPTWRFRLYEDGAGNGVAQIYGRLKVGEVALATTQAEYPLMIADYDGNAGTNTVKKTNTAASTQITCDPTTGALTVKSLTSGNVKLTATVPTGGNGFPILMHNGSSNDVKKSDNTCKYDAVQQVFHVKNITMDTTGEMYYKGQTLDARFGGSGSVLPLNYTSVYSSRYDSSAAAWTVHNITGFTGDDTDYSGSSTGRVFGHNNQIEWPTSSIYNGGQPKITEYGARVTTYEYYGAINYFAGVGFYSGDQIRIQHNDYAGWWMIHISLLYQINSGYRHMPYIRLMKQPSTGAAYAEQPQVSQGVEYLRHQVGELSNLTIHGPIYFANTTTAFRIYTLFNEEGASSPPAWDNETTNYLGLGLNISLTFMGNSSSNNETVTEL